MNKDKIIYKINTSVTENITKYYESLGKVIVIALSGGPDSTAMLHSLYSIKDKFDLTLHIAHFNHNQRKLESLNDVKFVTSPFIFQYASIDVP